MRALDYFIIGAVLIIAFAVGRMQSSSEVVFIFVEPNIRNSGDSEPYTVGKDDLITAFAQAGSSRALAAALSFTKGAK